MRECACVRGSSYTKYSRAGITERDIVLSQCWKHRSTSFTKRRPRQSPQSVPRLNNGGPGHELATYRRYCHARDGTPKIGRNHRLEPHVALDHYRFRVINLQYFFIIFNQLEPSVCLLKKVYYIVLYDQDKKKKYCFYKSCLF